MPAQFLKRKFQTKKKIDMFSTSGQSSNDRGPRVRTSNFKEKQSTLNYCQWPPYSRWWIRSPLWRGIEKAKSNQIKFSRTKKELPWKHWRYSKSLKQGNFRVRTMRNEETPSQKKTNCWSCTVKKNRLVRRKNRYVYKSKVRRTSKTSWKTNQPCIQTDWSLTS